jgi:hypothetical protein
MASISLSVHDHPTENSRLPGRYRRRVLVRLDGAGFSHQLLEP